MQVHGMEMDQARGYVYADVENDGHNGKGTICVQLDSQFTRKSSDVGNHMDLAVGILRSVLAAPTIYRRVA